MFRAFKEKMTKKINTLLLKPKRELPYYEKKLLEDISDIENVFCYIEKRNSGYTFLTCEEYFNGK